MGKRIAPIKYEKAQKELIYQLEQTAETASAYFFDLAMAQRSMNWRKKIWPIQISVSHRRRKIQNCFHRQGRLLTLKLDRVNAQNSLQNAEIDLKRAMFALAAYLNLDKNTTIKLNLPDYPKEMFITIDDALMYAKENNPQYLESEQQILQSEQALEKTKIEAFFNAGLSAT